MAIPMFNKNPLDPFGTNTLMSDIANTNQQVGLMNIPEQPSQQEQDFKRKQFGNMLLSFADVLKGRDPSAGVMQRTALLDAQKKEAERKAKLQQYKKNNPGMVNVLEALESGIPYQLLMLEQNKNKDLGKTKFANEDKLRDEHQKLSGTFIDVKDAYGRILTSAQEQTAASDLSLIFNYMKMLDPGSVVREGEFANAQNSAGVPNRIRAAYNNALSGERLAPATRADFINQSKGLYETQLAGQNYLDTNYKNLAKSYGLDDSKVVIDFGAPIAEKEFKYDISLLSDSDLTALDETKFTSTQIKIIEEEIKKRLN